MTGATVGEMPGLPPDNEVRLFRPGWRREPAPTITPPSERSWVVLPDRHGVAARIADALRDRRHRVVSWEPGPASLADAVESVRVDGAIVEVVYAAGLDHVSAQVAGTGHVGRYRRLVSDCARVGQAVATCPPGSVRLTVLASCAADVTGADVVDPGSRHRCCPCAAPFLPKPTSRLACSTSTAAHRTRRVSPASSPNSNGSVRAAARPPRPAHLDSRVIPGFRRRRRQRPRASACRTDHRWSRRRRYRHRGMVGCHSWRSADLGHPVGSGGSGTDCRARPAGRVGR